MVAAQDLHGLAEQETFRSLGKAAISSFAVVLAAVTQHISQSEHTSMDATKTTSKLAPSKLSKDAR